MVGQNVVDFQNSSHKPGKMYQRILVRFPFVMFKSSFASCAKLWEVTYAAALSKKCLSFMLGRQWVCTWCEACKVWVFAVEAYMCVGIYNCACFACDMSTWEIFTFEMLILLWNVYLWNAYFCEMFTCVYLWNASFVKCLLVYLWNIYLWHAYFYKCLLVYLWTSYLWNVYLWNAYLCLLVKCLLVKCLPLWKFRYGIEDFYLVKSY